MGRYQTLCREAILSGSTRISGDAPTLSSCSLAQHVWPVPGGELRSLDKEIQLTVFGAHTSPL